MSSTIVSQERVEVKHRRYVSAQPTVWEKDFAFGKHLYRCGKPLANCLSDATTEGWLEAEADYNTGKRLYNADKSIRECVGVDQEHGWMDAHNAKGAQYWWAGASAAEVM